ncbi:hypothetical protein ABIE45_003919 [Methylobacterium sp. OAE515]|uniref:hypothetical protein n=1 Tax=Methylobacterium sp. OAE515 TaxID=2817895 RepID=UPI001789BC2D
MSALSDRFQNGGLWRVHPALRPSAARYASHNSRSAGFERLTKARFGLVPALGAEVVRSTVSGSNERCFSGRKARSVTVLSVSDKWA